jgi:hypothetical protein
VLNRHLCPPVLMPPSCQTLFGTLWEKEKLGFF